MLLELLSENNTLEKSRRAVLIVALLILLFAVADFRSDEIEFLSLRIAFSREKFIALGQFFLIYFLFTYIVRILIQLGIWVAERGSDTVDKWESDQHDKVISAEKESSDENHSDNVYSDEHDDITYEASMRQRPYKFLKSFSLLFEKIFIVLLQYVFPVVLALLALFWPDSLSDLLQAVTSS
jgi:hypothetical protein